MGLIETEGLILKSYSLAEADKIVVVFTREQGLVRGVARGAKRLKSRFGSGLEPFSIVRLTYFQKEEKELVTISQTELIKTYFGFTSNLEILQKFAYLAELLTDFAPPHQSDERLYRMAKVCFDTAVEHPGFLENIVLYFEIWTLRLGGYLPDWKSCNLCRREFTPTESAAVLANFHLGCQNCQESRSNRRIGALTKSTFLMAQKLSPEKFIEFTRDKKDAIEEISVILRRQISMILGRETTGEKVLLASSK